MKQVYVVLSYQTRTSQFNWQMYVKCAYIQMYIYIVYMINQSTGMINTLQYKIAGLCYLKSFNPRHLLFVLV
jgi:hypothetical protein